MGNAFKFTLDGGKISISVIRLKNDVITTISDNGIGISLENQKILFKPFEQVNATANKNVQGTGLGLYLCKQFINLHGGQIWLSSKPNKGSNFSFSLPI